VEGIDQGGGGSEWWRRRLGWRRTGPDGRRRTGGTKRRPVEYGEGLHQAALGGGAVGEGRHCHMRRSGSYGGEREAGPGTRQSMGEREVGLSARAIFF
jgi:hypothetical protein